MRTFGYAALASVLVTMHPTLAAEPSVWGCLGVPPPEVATGGSRDAVGLVRARVPKHVVASLPQGERFAMWLHYPGFESYPAANLPAVHDVPTAVGTFSYCLLPQVPTEAPGEADGVLIHVAFDPARRGLPTYTFDPAVVAARTRRMLDKPQQDYLAKADAEVALNHAQLLREFDDFLEAPYAPSTRQAFLNALTQVARLRGGREQQLEPQRLLSREQREPLRLSGHVIPGHCYLIAHDHGATVELQGCPWLQLVDRWDRLRANVSSAGSLPRFAVASGYEHLESPDTTLTLTGSVNEQQSLETLVGFLAALPGLRALR